MMDQVIVEIEEFTNTQMEILTIQTSKEVKLQILFFNGPLTTDIPVILLAGWITSIKKFSPIVRGLLEAGHPVYFMDTRDKITSKISVGKVKWQDYTMDKYISDLHAVIKALQFSNGFYLLGSSFGASIVANYLASEYNNGQRSPIKTVLLIPTVRLKFPSWQKFVIRIPMELKPIIVFIVETYLKSKFRNPVEPELAYQLSEKLYNINANKVQASAIAVDKTGGINLLDLADNISDNVLVVGATNDLMHPEKLSRYFAKQLANSKYLNVHSNYVTHSPKMGHIASAYFNDVENYQLSMN